RNFAESRWAEIPRLSNFEALFGASACEMTPNVSPKQRALPDCSRHDSLAYSERQQTALKRS
ncbi:MAG: hypothetical protein ACPG4D_08445, partial [Alphaproteobacteria bacterium]